MMTTRTEERRIKQLQKIEEMFTHQNISDYDDFGTKMNLIGEDLGLLNPFDWWKKNCADHVEDKFKRAKRTKSPPNWTEFDRCVIAIMRRFDNTYCVTQDDIGHGQKDTFSGANEEDIAATSGKNQRTKKTAIISSATVTQTSGDSQTSSTAKTPSATVQKKSPLQNTDGVGNRVAENVQPLKSTKAYSTSTKNQANNGLSTRQATRKAAVISSATVTQTSGDFQPSSTAKTPSATVQKKSSRQITDEVGDRAAENFQPSKSTKASSTSTKNQANDKISKRKSIMRQSSPRGSKTKNKVRFNLTKMTIDDSTRKRKSLCATESSPPPPAKKSCHVSSEKSVPSTVPSQNNAPPSNDPKEAERAKSGPSTDTIPHVPIAPTSNQEFRREQLNALLLIAQQIGNLS